MLGSKVVSVMRRLKKTHLSGKTISLRVNEIDGPETLCLEPGMFRTQLSGYPRRPPPGAPDSGGESPRHTIPHNRQTRAASHRCGQGTRSPVGEPSFFPKKLPDGEHFRG